MPKIKLAVCDADVSYRERFTSYLAHHKAEEAEVYAYSNVQLFLEKRKEIAFDIMVLGEDFLEIIPELEKENIPILGLVDEHAGGLRETYDDVFVREASDLECNKTVEQQSRMETVPSVPKVTYLPRYQPMEVMWHKISVITARSHGSSHIKRLLPSVEITGVYAPGGHEMQMFFSMLYAGLLAQERRVLYLNFMPYVDFFELFGREDTHNMSDLILALRSNRLTAEKLHEFISEMDGIAYIAPFCNPENLHEVMLTDYQEILQAVMEYTDYEVIVVDFGMEMEQFSKMLDCCQRIYCLMKEGFFYQYQMNQFLEYLRCDSSGLEKKAQVVSLPFQAKWMHGGGNLMEQLKWSEFGDFVRRDFSGGSK